MQLFFARIFAVLLLFSAVDGLADTITFGSGTTWQVSYSSGVLLGNAQNVCLNATSPSTCPAGATVYGFAGSAWTADLSSITGTWIWAPGVTGATSPADQQTYDFSQSFVLDGSPISGSISVAVDDFAQVFVNGISVGTTGSLTDFATAQAAQSQLTSFDISSALTSGTNTITVRASNGPAYFAGCNGGCSYSQNAAGVVFGGSILTAVPEPSTVWLVGSSFLFLLLRRVHQ